MNETDSKPTNDSSSNDTDCNSQSLDASNRRIPKCKRLSNLKKNMVDTVEMQAEIQPMNNLVSTISQRPRRQVKHKFIKSVNPNVTVKSSSSETSNDVSDESASLLSNLSPNSKMRLVPMVYRLPMNTSKLNWQDVIGNSSMETLEMECGVKTILENEPTTPDAMEMEKERHKKLNNRQKAGWRARHLRQNVDPVEQIEYNISSQTIDDDVAEKKSSAHNTVTNSSGEMLYLLI